MFCISPMTLPDARAIAEWRYPPPYEMYSFTPSAALLAELLDGSYYACREGDALIGFFCFGGSARIPAEIDYAADPAFTDIGLGLRPDLCGQGRGAAFLQAGMEFGRAQLGAVAFRLVVAAWNERARRVYERCGFAARGVVHLNATGMAFVWMEQL